MSVQIDDNVVVELSLTSVALNERTYKLKREEVLANPNTRVIYITRKGLKPLQRRQVPGGKWMAMEVNAIPGLTDPTPTTTPGYVYNKQAEEELKPNYDIRPAGPIPGEMFLQIMEFFKAVMVGKFKGESKSSFTHGKYEAMAHVIWNPTTGYRVGIPSQRVTAGSVNYEHDDYDITKGDVVVVDIHSHNSMSAFFSGTDDNDDKHALIYTGVIGTLDKKPTWKFRLNNLSYKVEMDVEEIFDFTPEATKIPADWLDKVEVPVYTNNFGGGRFPRQGRGVGPEYQVFGGKNTGGKGTPGKDERTGGLNPSDLFSGLSGMDAEDIDEFYRTFGNAPGLDNVLHEDPFSEETEWKAGPEFTVAIKAYCGLDEVNSDQYPMLKTLEDYDHLLKTFEEDCDGLTPEITDKKEEIFQWADRTSKAPIPEVFFATLADLSKADLEDYHGVLQLVVPPGRKEWYSALDEAARYKYLHCAWSLMNDKAQGEIY